MKLLETISIRLFDPQNAHVIQNTFRQVKQGSDVVSSLNGASLFHSCIVPGDWTMQLNWLGIDLPKAKTALGRQLADSFRSIGMVHHTIWQFISEDMCDNAQHEMRGDKHEV